MASNRTIYLGTIGDNNHIFDHTPGEAWTYTIDGSAAAAQMSTSISTAAWSIDAGTASVSGEALASDVATALLTTTDEGCALIKVKLTMADSQVINVYLKINIKEPDCSGDSDIWD